MLEKLEVEMKVWVSNPVLKTPANTLRVVSVDLSTGDTVQVHDYPEARKRAAFRETDDHNILRIQPDERVYRTYEFGGNCIRNENSVRVLQRTN